MIPAFIATSGGLELAVILLVAILLFGANRLPGLARSVGQAPDGFKKGCQEVERELGEAAAPIRNADVQTDGDREKEAATA